MNRDVCEHFVPVELKCDRCEQTAEPVQEPVAWSFEARHIDTAFGPAVSIKHPGREHKYMRNVKPLYTAPPQRKPLKEWQINDLMSDIDPEDVCGWSFRQGVYAAEKHHGIGNTQE